NLSTFPSHWEKVFMAPWHHVTDLDIVIMLIFHNKTGLPSLVMFRGAWPEVTTRDVPHHLVQDNTGLICNIM
ncbi:hypothetical protein P3465_23605, partial [Vibrio parahaemolyticus]|nr:hypothetical protein [Vibrio parahaemolyticus]